MTFDPSTSYQSDWQLLDFVEEATWEKANTGLESERVDGFKVRRGDANTPEFASLGVGLGLRSSAAPFIVWPPIPADDADPIEFDPQAGQVLRTAKAGWIIKAFERSIFGRWAVMCEQEKLNTVD